MERADIGGAVTEHRDRHAVLAVVLERQRRAGSDRHAGPDDGEGGQQPDRRVAQVHRSAHTSGAPFGTTHDFGEHGSACHAERQRHAVPAIGGGHDVGGAQRWRARRRPPPVL